MEIFSKILRFVRSPDSGDLWIQSHGGVKKRGAEAPRPDYRLLREGDLIVRQRPAELIVGLAHRIACLDKRLPDLRDSLANLEQIVLCESFGTLSVRIGLDPRDSSVGIGQQRESTVPDLLLLRCNNWAVRCNLDLLRCNKNGADRRCRCNDTGLLHCGVGLAHSNTFMLRCNMHLGRWAPLPDHKHPSTFCDAAQLTLQCFRAWQVCNNAWLRITHLIYTVIQITLVQQEITVKIALRPINPSRIMTTTQPNFDDEPIQGRYPLTPSPTFLLLELVCLLHSTPNLWYVRDNSLFLGQMQCRVSSRLMADGTVRATLSLWHRDPPTGTLPREVRSNGQKI